MLNFKKKINISGDYKYNSDEMLEAIVKHFYGICYLCGSYIPVNFEPEHFYPKSKFKKIENEPINLFCSCGRCNQIKSNTYNSVPKKEILNSKIDDVENIIILKFDRKSKIANQIDISINKEICKGNSVLKSNNTVELLNKIFNGKNTNSVMKAGKLRNEIKKETEMFYNLIGIYEKTRLKSSFSNKIKNHISKTQQNKEFSNFVSFKRQIIKDNPKYKEMFNKYFD